MRLLSLPNDLSMIASQYRSGRGAPAIARALGVSTRTIQDRLKEAGVPRRSPRDAAADRRALSPAALEEAIAQHNAGDSNRRIAARLGVTHRVIQDRLREAGCRPHGRGRHRYSIRGDAFDDWSDAATRYWIGFLMGDANVGVGRVVLTLNARDIEHLEKLRAFVGGNHPIRVRRVLLPVTGRWTAHASLAMSSAQLVLSLAAAGVVPRKSLVAVAPDVLARSRDFWRGIVDANGTIELVGGRRRLSLVGSVRLMPQWASFVAEECGVPAPRVAPYGKISSCAVGGPWAYDVIEKLYGAAEERASLSRKLELARRLLARPRLGPRQSAVRFLSHHA